MFKHIPMLIARLWRRPLVGLALLALTLWAFFWMKSKGAFDELARAVAVSTGRLQSRPGATS
jgi:hypothetical protein